MTAISNFISDLRSKHLHWLASLAFATTVLFGTPAFYTLFALMGVIFGHAQYLLPLLFFSGFLKYAPAISNIGIDVTLVSFILVVAYNLYQLLQVKSVVFVTRTNAILVLMLMSSLYAFYNSPVPFDALKYSGLMVVVFYLPLILMIINTPDANKCEKWPAGFYQLTCLIVTAWVGTALHNELFSIPIYQIRAKQFPVAHISAFGEDYLPLALIVALFFLAVYCQSVSRPISVAVKVIILGALAILLLNLPSRGVLISLMLSLIIGITLTQRKKIEKLPIVSFYLAGITLMIAAYLIFFLSAENKMLLNRLTDFNISSETFQLRLSAISLGLHHWIDQPFSGIGMDATAFLGKDMGLYAHNIFIELVVDYGCVAAIPFIVYIFYSFTSFRLVMQAGITENNNQKIWLCLCYLFLLFMQQFSGTLGNARMFWIISAVMIALAEKDRRLHVSVAESTKK